MRRRFPLLLTMVVMALTARADAQMAVTEALATQPPATPELIVARLMSFDRNHDGVLAREELPERMRAVLARADALNPTSIRMLAERPVPAGSPAGGIQVGRYGFGDDDTGFDTRLHIDGAIDDLRLARATRDEARIIANTFMDRQRARRRDTLIATVTPLVNGAQLAAITETLKHPSGVTTAVVVASSVPAAPPPSPSSRSARQGVTASVQVTRTRVVRQDDLTRLVAAMDMSPDLRRQLNAAIRQFNGRERLTDSARAALVGEMTHALTNQQRQDLDAALARRPIVKQGVAHFNMVTFTGQTLLPPQRFGLSDLVLR